VGQEVEFPTPEPSDRYRFDQETFAGTRGNGRDAPKAVVGTNWPGRLVSATTPRVRPALERCSRHA